MPLGLNTLCSTRNLLALNTERSQWYAGPQYNVAVGAAQSVQPQCAYRRMQYVANPGRECLAARAWLKPGEEAEVFIAMRPVVQRMNTSACPVPPDHSNPKAKP